MTIDQGPDTSRYQGLVALEGKDLEHAAHEYFLRSEQIPTRVRLAVGEELSASADGARHRWRAGGMLLQFLPKSPERARQPDLDPGDAAGGHRGASGARGRCLGRRPLADRDRRGRRTDRSRGLGRAAALSAVPRARRARVPQQGRGARECSCSRPSVADMLKSFSQDDRDHMVENGKITVTCEFCNSTYVFEPARAWRIQTSRPA